MSNRLWVGNLAYDAGEADIRSAFAEFEVGAISIPIDRETNHTRGFAFVDLSDAEEAARAMTALDGFPICGRKVRIDIARPRENRGKRERE
jgi:RNA recognition motif-containing protein